MPRLVNHPLPDYEKPPVIEVLIGTQFQPLDGFSAVHYGLFWNLVRKDYPTIEQLAPLAPTFERLAESPGTDLHRLEFSQIRPLPRVFYVDLTSSWLIQLQFDRLLQNWRRHDGNDGYPRFPTVLKRFKKSWKALRRLCELEGIAFPVVNQLEVTYVNHIPVGEGWTDLHDLGGVFPDLAWRRGDRFLEPPIGMLWNSAFNVPEIDGRLRVSVRHVTRKADNKEVLLCELTARGMPQQQDDDAIDAWLQLARATVVNAFADLTDSKVQQDQWGREC